MPSFGNSQELVEIANIRDSAIILKDGGLRQILMVGGTNFSLKSEEEQNTLTTNYQNFLNSIDFPLQILIHSRKININQYLDDLGAHMQEEPSPLLQNQIAEYREFIRQFVMENAIMEKSFFVVVPWHQIAMPGPSAGSGLLAGLPFFGKKDIAKEETEKEGRFQKDLSQIKQRTNQVLVGLATMELEAVLLNDEQLTELFYNFYNPGPVERENINLPPKTHA